MKLNREKFYDKINLLFQEVSTNKRLISEVTEQLKHRGFLPSDVAKVLRGIVPLQTIPEVELGVIIQTIYNIIDNGEFNLERYFTDTEIKNIKIYKKTREKEDNYIYLENVIQVNEKQFIAPKVSYHDIKKWYENYLITYNFATQREKTTKNIGGRIIESITLNANSIKNIKQKMLEGKFTSNMITLNIRNIWGDEHFVYDEQEKTLLITPDENTFVDIIDGMHRCAAIIKALQENPNLEGYMVVNVLHYTEEEAQGFIWQEDQRNPINRNFIKIFNPDNLEIKLTKEINNEGNSNTNEMYNKIAIDNKEVKYTDKYITAENLSFVLKNLFRIENARDARKVKNKIIDGMNIILGYLKEKGYTKENSICYSQSAIIGYISIIASVDAIKDDELEQKIDRLLKKNVGKDELQQFEKSRYRKNDILEIAKYYNNV